MTLFAAHFLFGHVCSPHTFGLGMYRYIYLTWSVIVVLLAKVELFKYILIIRGAIFQGSFMKESPIYGSNDRQVMSGAFLRS